MSGDDASGIRTPTSLGWTLALSVAGIGLCVSSYLLFSQFGYRSLGVVQPLDGTDRLLVGDPAVTGSRTISRLEYLAPQYLAELAPWLGGIGLATIVASVFRLAGSDIFARRRGIDDGGRPRTTTREPFGLREL